MWEKSTATKLVLLVEMGVVTYCISTDFVKSFDRINPTLLIRKMKAISFYSSLLNPYLCGKTVWVKIKSCLSRDFHITLGVPQCSHLGPFLFLFDVSTLLKKVVTLLFADDLKMFAGITDSREQTSCSKNSTICCYGVIIMIFTWIEISVKLVWWYTVAWSLRLESLVWSNFVF